MFRFLSGSSAYSLIVLGALSFIISAVNVSVAGMAVSAAMLVHGGYEFRARRLFLETKNARWSRRMGGNQIALAASLSLYAFWQLYVLDDDEVRKILLGDAAQPFFRLLDPRMQIELLADLPGYVKAVYAGVIALAWAGCGATALFYARAGRMSAA